MQPAAITYMPDALEGDIREAWSESCLAGLAEDVAGRLLRDAHPLALAAGEPLHRSGDDPGTYALALVVHGLLRIYRRAADGREVTVRYVAPGGLVGLPAVLGHPSTAALDCDLCGHAQNCTPQAGTDVKVDVRSADVPTAVSQGQITFSADTKNVTVEWILKWRVADS